MSRDSLLLAAAIIVGLASGIGVAAFSDHVLGGSKRPTVTVTVPRVVTEKT